jgi:ribosomal protein L11 methyltransferase
MGTAGIREESHGREVVLTAGFEDADVLEVLCRRLGAHCPEWFSEPLIDWVQQTQQAWPAKPVGNRLFLAAPWNAEPTPQGRLRIVHNPGLASGTGEHPCTQLALLALEQHIRPGDHILDIGTGSGILAIAAARLGARATFAVDNDFAALETARENFELNDLAPKLAAGSADCVATACADITVANINATVLLDMLDELLRVTAPGGCLILTGFTNAECEALARNLPPAEPLALGEWRCLVVKPSSVCEDWSFS